MNPRFRRLEADYQDLVAAFAGHQYIVVEPVGAVPPERYRVIYNVPGLCVDRDGKASRVFQHLVHIQLPAAYPREKPYCTTEATVFHPNFGAYICIADFWSPSQSLVDVVVQIGDMLQYKLYNTRSPLNAPAAQWAAANVGLLPIGTLELRPREPEVKLRLSATTKGATT